MGLPFRAYSDEAGHPFRCPISHLAAVVEPVESVGRREGVGGGFPSDSTGFTCFAPLAASHRNGGRIWLGTLAGLASEPWLIFVGIRTFGFHLEDMRDEWQVSGVIQVLPIVDLIGLCSQVFFQPACLVK